MRRSPATSTRLLHTSERRSGASARLHQDIRSVASSIIGQAGGTAKLTMTSRRSADYSVRQVDSTRWLAGSSTRKAITSPRSAESTPTLPSTARNCAGTAGPGQQQFWSRKSPAPSVRGSFDDCRLPAWVTQFPVCLGERLRSVLERGHMGYGVYASVLMASSPRPPMT
jgi:hypothetical protein